MKSVVVILFVISAVLHCGFAQHCYDCNSLSHPHCSDEPTFDAAQNTGNTVDCADVLRQQSGAQAGAGSGYGGGQSQAGAGSSSGGNNKGNKQHCFKVIVKNEHNDYATVRGCSQFANEKQACDHLKADNNVVPHGSKLDVCKICAGDLCNSARNLGVTFTLFLLPAFVFIKNF